MRTRLAPPRRRIERILADNARNNVDSAVFAETNGEGERFVSRPFATTELAAAPSPWLEPGSHIRADTTVEPPDAAGGTRRLAAHLP